MTLPKHFTIGLLVFLFFFNRVGLPFGVSIDMVLAPFFLVYLYYENAKLPVIKIIGFFCVFSCIHLIQGVHFPAFAVSNLVFFVLILTFYSFYTFLQKRLYFDEIILRITQVNFIFTLLAIVLLAANFYIETLWYLVPYTSNAAPLPRLKLFTDEAAHYSFLLLPVFYYWLFRLIQELTWKNLFYCSTIVLSLVLSFSLGVLGVIAITLILILLIYARFIYFHKPLRRVVLLGFLGLAIASIGLFYFFPHNPLALRLHNLFSGLDTSGRGRTYESFQIGWQVIQHTHPVTGIGLGQFKISGKETLLFFYKYLQTPETVRLPNAMAETMVSFGIIGAVLRVGVVVYFAIRQSIFQNIFQTALFLSLFIYQFTGGFLFNSFEYYYWLLVFLPVFQRFDIQHYFNQNLKKHNPIPNP